MFQFADRNIKVLKEQEITDRKEGPRKNNKTVGRNDSGR